MGVRKKLACEEEMKKIMMGYYMEIFNSDKPKAWVTSGAPVELLLAYDVLPVFPENYGAMIAARHQGSELCATASGLGFDECICSYARCTIGSTKARQGPLGPLPAPDFLLACNNGCGTMFKWFEVLSKRFGVPLLFLDTPYCSGLPSVAEKTYVQHQLENIIDDLSCILKKPVDEDKLYQVLQTSGQTVRLWRRIQDLRSSRPSPLNSPDMFLHMAIIVTLRGSETALQYYQTMLEEVEERVKKGIGAVENERYRLLWDHIPLWYAMRDFFDFCADLGICFASDTYTNVWSGELNLDRPLESLAKSYQSVLPNLRLPRRVEAINVLIEDHSIDGFVMHSNRSCKSYCLGQYELARQITQNTGIRGLILEADMVDSRCYSENQVKDKLLAYLESLP